jgi:hypothetical protein
VYPQTRTSKVVKHGAALRACIFVNRGLYAYRMLSFVFAKTSFCAFFVSFFLSFFLEFKFVVYQLFYYD